MRYAALRTGLVLGLEFQAIKIEVSIAQGLPSFSIAGLSSSAASDARVRIKSALSNQGFTFPSRRVVVNVAPSDLKKDVPIFDLPIALGVILAMQEGRAFQKSHNIIFGELSLDGGVCSSPSSMALCLAARNSGLKSVYLNASDAPMCAHISGIDVHGVEDLRALVAAFSSPTPLTPIAPASLTTVRDDSLDFEQVQGLSSQKRVMMICAAGHHNLLMSGSPGSGKSMLAHRLHTILPDLTLDQYLELRAIKPANYRKTSADIDLTPPLRAPHHTISTAGLVGGGCGPAPGEISLAHHGVLFLDELLEFKKTQLESLRTPLEAGRVLLSRAGRQVVYPSRFILVGAYNPCPCGYLFDPHRECRCTTLAIASYQARLSGPLLERFDVHVAFQSQSEAPKTSLDDSINSHQMRARVSQAIRFGQKAEISKHRALTPDAVRLLTEISKVENHSFRQRTRLMSVAKTISNLEGSVSIETAHIIEALTYLPRARTRNGSC